jgi:hypothetical protein
MLAQLIVINGKENRFLCTERGGEVDTDLCISTGTALGLDGEENRFLASDLPRPLGHPSLTVEPEYHVP